MSGDTVTVTEAFSGNRLKVEPGFALFLGNEAWETKALMCRVYEMEVGISDPSIIRMLGITNEIDRDDVRAVLTYLAINWVGKDTLEIPEGEEEVNLILGYQGGWVFFIEHELEPGKEEEFHLHVRPKKEKWKRAPRVLVVT
jgi:hypothetical protein